MSLDNQRIFKHDTPKARFRAVAAAEGLLSPGEAPARNEGPKVTFTAREVEDGHGHPPGIVLTENHDRSFYSSHGFLQFPEPTGNEAVDKGRIEVIRKAARRFESTGVVPELTFDQ